MSKVVGAPTGVTIVGALVSVLDVAPLALLGALVLILGAQNLPATAILVVGIASTVLGLAWLVLL